MSVGVDIIVSILASILGSTSVSRSLVEAFRKLFEERKAKDKELASLQAERSPEEVAKIQAKEADIATETAITVLNSTYDATSQIRDERMRQARYAFNAALTLVVVGVLIIFTGVAMLWFGNSVEPGAITVGVGAITEVVSAILFKLNKEVNVRLDEVRKELSAIETARIGLGLAKEIDNLEKRDDAIANLAERLQPQNG